VSLQHISIDLRGVTSREIGWHPQPFLDRLKICGVLDRDGEARINAFAAELLMPKKLLAGALDNRMLDLDDDRLIALAKRFKVSLMALQYRLQRM
jgi:Zn-dependent peptidase ImmA (M78 family)